MRPLNDLKRELANYESELASITRNVQKDTPFALHALDGKSESYTVTSYTDESRARYLMRQIDSLKRQIDSYSQDAETVRYVQERKESEDREQAKEDIIHNAMVIYEDAVDKYMNRNFWGKAKAMLSGKKPKKDLTQQQLVDKYGSEAIDRILQPGVEKHEAEKAYQIEKAKKEFANNPEELAKTIQQIEQFYSDKYNQAKDYYDQIYGTMKEQGRQR